jgi:hypothetical protein
MIVSELALYLAGGVGLLGLGLGTLVGYYGRGYVDEPEEFDAALEGMDEEGHAVVLPAPETSGSLLSIFRSNQHRKKAKKLAGKGYVRWFKFDGMLERPRWVKPERSGSGVPKYFDKDDDCHYLFPEDALVTDSRTGAPVAVHHSGQAEPVNLADPEYPPIDSDRLEEIINLEIESEPPGWLSKFDLDSTTIMFVMIALILLFAGAQQVL